MIGWICFALLGVGTVYGIISGNAESLLNGLLQAPSDCVSLLLRIGGSLCLFSGVIRVAQGAGLVDLFSRFLARPIGFLIPATKKNEPLRRAVTMNLASNFFGLGNGATPHGIRAASLMKGQKMSRSLASFLILNTCSLQLIPATVGALRLAHGAKNAFDIMPSVWLVQIASCFLGIVLIRCLFREDL